MFQENTEGGVEMMLKITKTNISKKGGETMRTLGLVLALIVVAGACQAATVKATYDIYEAGT